MVLDDDHVVNGLFERNGGSYFNVQSWNLPGITNKNDVLASFIDVVAV